MCDEIIEATKNTLTKNISRKAVLTKCTSTKIVATKNPFFLYSCILPALLLITRSLLITNCYYLMLPDKISSKTKPITV